MPGGGGVTRAMTSTSLGLASSRNFPLNVRATKNIGGLNERVVESFRILETNSANARHVFEDERPELFYRPAEEEA